MVVVLLILWFSQYILDAPLEPGERPLLDIVGSILSALGIGLFVFGILLAGTYGWWEARRSFFIGGIEISPFGLSPTPLFIAGGVVILLIFALWEHYVSAHGGTPLVRLDVLRDSRIKIRPLYPDGTEYPFCRLPFQHGPFPSDCPGP